LFLLSETLCIGSDDGWFRFRLLCYLCNFILYEFCYIHLQEEDYHLNARHLTIRSPPSGKYDLEIVTEICPQKNTSLEVNENSRCRVCFFIVLLYFHLSPQFGAWGEEVVFTMDLISCRDFTNRLGISVLNVRLKVSVKLHFIRLSS